MKEFFECGMAKEINNQLMPETQQVNHGQVQQTQHAITPQKMQSNNSIRVCRYKTAR